MCFPRLHFGSQIFQGQTIGFHCCRRQPEDTMGSPWITNYHRPTSPSIKKPSSKMVPFESTKIGQRYWNILFQWKNMEDLCMNHTYLILFVGVTKKRITALSTWGSLCRCCHPMAMAAASVELNNLKWYAKWTHPAWMLQGLNRSSSCFSWDPWLHLDPWKRAETSQFCDFFVFWLGIGSYSWIQLISDSRKDSLFTFGA